MTPQQIAKRLQQADAMIEQETEHAQKIMADLETKDAEVLKKLNELKAKKDLTEKQKKEYAGLLTLQQAIRHSHLLLEKQLGLASAT